MQTLDATVGGPDSNSYVDIAWADDCLDGQFPRPAGWFTLTADDKARALMTATTLVDVSVKWYGGTTYPDQALQWPRTGMTDARGHDIPPNILPDDLKKAVCLLAASLITNGSSSSAYTGGDITSVSVGGISVSLDHSKANEQADTGELPPWVWALLKLWGALDSPGAKAGMGSIIRG